MLLMLWGLVLQAIAAENVGWVSGKGFRYRHIPIEPSQGQVSSGTNGRVGFTRLTPVQTGVNFTNAFEGDAFLTNAVAHNGAGLAIGDIDGDGLPDLYFCSLQGTNRLYRNLGHWKFEEQPPGPVTCAGQVSMGAVFADVDGDGDRDLLVNGIPAGTRLFLNDGKGNFTESLDSGLSRTASATSMALADIDGDGDLDLYCAHYIDVMHLSDPTTRFAISKLDGQWTVTKVNDITTRSGRFKNRFEALPDGSVRELPEVHGLYRNDGKGHFTAIQSEPGVFMDETGKPIAPPRDWGLAVQFRDFTGDGAPDLYVCNDNASPDRMWINTGRGTFRAASTYQMRHTSRSSMGVDFADVNRDGRDDFFVVDMLARSHGKRMEQLVREHPGQLDVDRADARPRFNRNTLMLGQVDGSFAEVALFAGVAASDWSWCPMFVDVDLDGYEDLLITNGFSFDVMDQDSADQIRAKGRQLTIEQRRRQRQFNPRWPTPNAVFRNRGDGSFEPMLGRWGFEQDGISYGAALADLDNDGDLDVVVNQLNDVAGLYRNDAESGRVEVRLRGTSPNTEGIGAKITLSGGPVNQSQEIHAGGRYLSGDQAVRVFALPTSAGTKGTLEVIWRDQKQSRVTEVEANRIYEIDEAMAEAWQDTTPRRVQAPLFEDRTSWISHDHTDEPFDDWSTQPLLPRRLSRLGPGLAWFDQDGDGWEDLLIPSGRGGNLAMLKNESGSEFKKGILSTNAPMDQGSVLGWVTRSGAREVLIAQSGFELGLNAEGNLQLLSSAQPGAPGLLSLGKMNPGPMLLTDLDGDGAPELFVGGRFQSGRYPEPVSSQVWKRSGNQWTLDATLSAPFKAVGLVSGAVAVDLDGDGRPELVLATEWGAVRVFKSGAGQIDDKTAEWGLAGFKGWWNSVATGDFDGDGRMDLVCGNWGRNSIYELYRPVSLKVAYGDWNGDGTIQLIESWQHEGQWLPVRDRTWLARGLPDLQTRFSTHHEYGRASLDFILGASRTGGGVLEANHLESMVFLNRGNRLEAIPLPPVAQWAPVFGIAVADFDGDGKEDLFLAQNFFGVPADLSRDDAGHGLWLRGLGDGRFDPMDSEHSGIVIHGEQRGVAICDFDHDGRVDLAVAQVGGATRLFRNRLGKAGLRVQLKGPDENPTALGAQIAWVRTDGRKGPVRSVGAGSGYWSQDASVQVLALLDGAQSVWVRWPGGKEQTIPVRPGATELGLEYPR